MPPLLSQPTHQFALELSILVHLLLMSMLMDSWTALGAPAAPTLMESTWWLRSVDVATMRMVLDTALQHRALVIFYLIVLDSKDWKSAIQTQAKGIKNTCHSLNRFNCYNTDSSLTAQMKTDFTKTSSAHLYYKAVDCAQDVLAGSYIKYSFFAVLSILAFIF